MMKCPMCGENIQPEGGRCPSCGMSLRQTPDSQRFGQPPSFPGQPSHPLPPPAPPHYAGPECGISKKEFYKYHASKETKSSLVGAAVILYICAIINLFVGYIPDAVIMVVLGLFLHLRGSRPCAVILMVYSILSCIITTLMRGRFSGWLLVFAGIVAVRAAFALEKEYRVFRGQSI